MQAEKSNSYRVPSKRDIWDKINIFIKAIGILFVSGAITFYGIYSENKRAKSQLEIAKENKRAQLYAQTMNSRQYADANVKKGLLDILMKDYLTQKDTNKKLLILDLLALNLQENLHLKPLFERFEAELPMDSPECAQLRYIARGLKNGQINRLVGDGASQYSISLQLNETESIPSNDKHARVQLSLIDLNASGVRLRMDLSFIGLNANGTKLRTISNQSGISGQFSVTYYDMPFLDYMVHGDQRYAVVLRGVDLKTPAQASLMVVIYARDYFGIQDRIRIDRLIDRTSDANK